MWLQDPLGYDDDMPDPLTSLLLVLALAAGLGSAIFVAQRVQTGQAEFYRYYLTHILLFNLLILAGLVLRFVQPQEPLFPGLVPLALGLLAALKLGWLYSFFITTRLLIQPVVPDLFKKSLFRIGLLILITYVVLGGLAWFNSLNPLLETVMIALETLVVGGAVWAAGTVTVAARRVPAGRRKNALAIFGGFHLALLLMVLAAQVVGWIRPGPQEFAQTMVNSTFLLLFNLFPPFWLRQFQPAPGETESDKFESLGVTPREKQIVQLIQAGKTNQEIADELFISVATVKDHNNNLFRKCGVRNRVELTNLFR